VTTAQMDALDDEGDDPALQTPLELLSPGGRKRAYLGYALVSTTCAATLAGFAAISQGAPPLLLFVAAFVQTAGAGFGLVAASNIRA
jgi:hypothetical protein